MFKIKIPLNQVSLAKVGSNSKNTEQVSEQVKEQVKEQVIPQKPVADIEKAILNFDKKPKSHKEIQEYLGFKSRNNLIYRYIRPFNS